MTDEQALYLARESFTFAFVRVTASDYSYDGWIVAAARKKRSDKVRVVVEDVNGRWFIHNPGQLEQINTEKGHA